MESRTDELAARLLRCPVGCNVLRTIERDRVPVALAVTPPQAFARVAIALDALDPWSARGFERARSAALSSGARLASLAIEVAAHPGSRWWTSPIDRARQGLVVGEGLGRVSPRRASPASDARWENYAQRPVGWRITSTLRGGSSCLDTVIATGVGDWAEGSPHRRFEARLGEASRVIEITGPSDWHDLCASYARVNEDRTSPAGAGTLVPDWTRVAEQWHGVHLTFMALLTTPFVRHRSVAGASMLWSWDSEGTIWLPGAPVHAGPPLPPPDRDLRGSAVTARLRD